MSDALESFDEIPRDEQMLGQLAEMDLALAKEVFVAARAAETPEQMAELVRAYQRVARSMRQSLALLDRFRRARAEGGPAPVEPSPRAEPGPRPSPAVAARKAELRAAVSRLIWNEYEHERESCDHLLRALDTRLEIQARWPDFAEAVLDDQVGDLCAYLGLPEAAAEGWRDLPDRESG